MRAIRVSAIAAVLLASARIHADPVTRPVQTPTTMPWNVNGRMEMDQLLRHSKLGETIGASVPPPATQPADPTMDFLINSAAKPATQSAPAPATQAAPSTLVNHGQADDTRPAILTLNDGKTVTGQASTTADKPVRIWDASIKDYRDIPFALIKSATAVVNWERDEPEWQFKESGSDVKVLTGRTYPARETQYEVILLNGDKITGDVAAPIYLDTGETTKIYVLHKRDKGELGQKLADLVYVKKIEFKDVKEDKPENRNPKSE